MKFLLLFCAIILCQSFVTSIKLNFPRVLLPVFQKISINFTLEVIEGGCFKWYVNITYNFCILF